jgi:AraC-like DNA-binding protein
LGFVATTGISIMSEKIFVKNMVCGRCKLAVRQALEQLNIHPVVVELGEVTLNNPLSDVQSELVDSTLATLGFELISDKRSRLIESIKSTIIEMIHHRDELPKVKLSVLLAEKFGYHSNYLSNLFSQVEGITIEQFFLKQRIEKVKEMIVYDQLALEEIAFVLGFSSASHMGKQFKQLTGMTPASFKKNRTVARRPIDNL